MEDLDLEAMDSMEDPVHMGPWVDPMVLAQVTLQMHLLDPSTRLATGLTVDLKEDLTEVL